jgi:photosystem II stability/assembly factor-like uncharacterized protein
MKKIGFSLFCLCSLVIHAQWYPQTSNTGYGLNGVYFTSSTTGWAVGDTGTFLSTTNAGITWNLQSPGVQADLYAIEFWAGSYGWIAGDSTAIIATTNGGTNWDVLTGNVSYKLTDISFYDPLNGCAVGYDHSMWTGQVFTTNDGGNFWKVKTDGSWMGALFAVLQVSPDTIICGGSGGGQLYTYDSGAVWKLKTLGMIDEAIFAFCHRDINNVWLATDSGYIYRNMNDHFWWTQQTSGTNNRLNSIFFIDNNNGWAVGNNGTIIATKDAGVNWNLQVSGTTENLNAVHFSDAQNGWIAGENGTILHTTNGGFVGSGLKTVCNTTISCYPNPVKDRLVIKTGEVPQHVQVTLVTADGRTVFSHAAETVETEVNMAGLKDGLYIVRIRIAEGVVTRLIVKASG